MDFFWRLHCSPYGVLRPEIFTRAKDWPTLASAHAQVGWGPPKNFVRENLKFGLKLIVLRSITSGLVGVTSRDFFQLTLREEGVIIWVQFLQLAPRNLWRPKMSKIRRDFWQLSTFIANISGTDQHIEHLKSFWHFSGNYIWPLGGAAPSNFYAR